MSFFENENIKKGWNSKKNFLLLSIGIIVVSILCYFWGASIVKEKSKKVDDLENIISLKMFTREKVNRKTKLTINYSPYLLAEKDDTSAAFYIVANEKYFYIAKMYKSKALGLTKSVTENGYDLVGYTSEVPEEVKGFAIDEYNKTYGDELERKLTLSDYDNYFGDVCIDLVKSESALAPFQYSVFYIGLIFGIVFLIVAIIMIIAYKAKVRKLMKNNQDELDELNNEINSGETTFYDKGKVYLTKNYILDVNGLQYYKYKDIIWVYKHIQRVNGVVSYQCLMIATNDGKQAMIAMNARDNYEKIMDEIKAKNNDVMIGYDKEKIAAFKAKKKEIKAEKKQNKASK